MVQPKIGWAEIILRMIHNLSRNKYVYIKANWDAKWENPFIQICYNLSQQHHRYVLSFTILENYKTQWDMASNMYYKSKEWKMDGKGEKRQEKEKKRNEKKQEKKIKNLRILFSSGLFERHSQPWNTVFLSDANIMYNKRFSWRRWFSTRLSWSYENGTARNSVTLIITAIIL